MSDVWPIFSGRASESAVEFLEGLDVAAQLSLSNASEDNKALIMQVRLRDGLRGDAKTWYRNESTPAERTDYNALSEASKTRFQSV